MTTSTDSMKRYTTTEYGKQNMFAHEPQVEVLDVNYWENAEQLNGRLAMIGFFAAIHNYILTGMVIPGIFLIPKVSYTTRTASYFLTLLQIKRKEKNNDTRSRKV